MGYGLPYAYIATQQVNIAMLNSNSIVQMCAKIAALSSNQANLQAADFLSFADLVVDTLCAEIMSSREEFLIYQEPIAVAANQSTVRIPYRALNGIVRYLWWEDGTGQRSRMWAKALEDIENYNTFTSFGTPIGFYLQGNSIILLPTPNIAGTLQVAYPFRPNDLTDVSNTQQIITINGITATVANIPSTWVNGGLYDIIDNRSGNGIIAYDLVGSISGSTISFNQSLAVASPGQYIAPAGTTPIPMLPEEAHNLLLEMTVLRIEVIRGNPQRVKNSASLVQDARKGFDHLLSNRVIGKPHATGGGSPHLPRGMRPY